ncbi:Uncharacterised protein [uncultured archaeon]|nr:Uncharacterised protein [uncultured archaeon]
MKFINTGVKANAFEAPRVAKQHGGRSVNHPEADEHEMASCHLAESRIKAERRPLPRDAGFWAGWAAQNVFVEKGKDLVDRKTGVLIAYSDIEKAHKARIEAGKRGIIGVKGLFFVAEPEEFTFKNGLYVHENSKITVVDDAMPYFGEWGKADPATKIAAKTSINPLPSREKRYNHIYDGIRPLVRGGIIIHFGGRVGVQGIDGTNHPSNKFLVLAIADEAKQ